MTRRIDISLNELRELRGRIDGQHLEPDDWPIVEGLVTKLITRAESQQERMLAKIAAQQASGADGSAPGESSGDGVLEADADATSTTEGNASSEAPVSKDSASVPESGEKSKGHGRNGVAAFTNGQHINHELGPDIVGTLCTYCSSNCVRHAV